MTLSKQQSVLSFIILAAGLSGLELWFVQANPAFADPNLFSWAITTDIIVGIPLLFFAFVTRKKLLPHLTLLPVFYLAVQVAEYVLPLSYHQYHINPVNGVLSIVIPIGELAALAYVGYKARTIIRQYRRHRHPYTYAPDVILRSVSQVFDANIGRLLALELSAIYYALCGWFLTPKEGQGNYQYFSYYRKAGYGGIVAVLLMAIAVETLALHLLLSIWSETLAWFFTVLGLYGAVGLVADFQAVRNQPIILTPSHLHLRIGLRIQGDIPLYKIASLTEVTPGLDKKAPGYINCVTWGTPNLIIELNESVEFTQMFGKKTAGQRIGICLDEREGFRRALDLWIEI